LYDLGLGAAIIVLLRGERFRWKFAISGSKGVLAIVSIDKPLKEFYSSMSIGSFQLSWDGELISLLTIS